jgi:hypothetical protein
MARERKEKEEQQPRTNETMRKISEKFRKRDRNLSQREDKERQK